MLHILYWVYSFIELNWQGCFAGAGSIDFVHYSARRSLFAMNFPGRQADVVGNNQQNVMSFGRKPIYPMIKLVILTRTGRYF